MVEASALPRVTEILSILRDPEVEDWYVSLGDKVARRKQRSAARIGTKLDTLIKADVRDEVVKVPTKPYELKMGWQAWQQFQRERGITCYVPERKVHTEFGYQGEPDLAVCARCRVIDVKVTSAIRQKHWIQVHAYVPLLWERTDWPCVTVAILRLDTFLGTYQYEERLFKPSILETFLHLKEVYRAWYWHPTELLEQSTAGGTHDHTSPQSTEAQLTP